MSINHSPEEDLYNEIHTYKGLHEALLMAAGTDRGIHFIEGKEKENFLPYKDLYRQALCIASGLRDRGIRDSAEIIIQASDNESFIKLFWGAILGGYKPIPLSLGFTDDHRLKLLKIWQLLESPYLIHDAPRSFFPHLEDTGKKEKLESIVREIRENNCRLDEALTASPLGYPIVMGPDEPVFIQFSSGSTGHPKGVAVTHRNILDNIYYTSRHLKFTQNDRFLDWMPLTHDLGLIFFHLLPLVLKLEQFLIPTQLFIRYPTLWMHKMSEHRATITASPNFGLRFFLDHYSKEQAETWDLGCIKYVLNAAEPISLSTCDRFCSELEAYGFNNALYAGYGLAEATLVVSIGKVDKGIEGLSLNRNSLGVGQKIEEIDRSLPEAVSFVKCGSCIESVELRTTDDAGNVLDERTIGHIEMKGLSVIDGYYQNDEATRTQVTDDGWFKTGDLGFFIGNQIVITGRSKEIVFVGGLNYYPHDIENVLHDVKGTGLNKIVATGVRNDVSEMEELILFVYYKGKPKKFEKLATELRDRLLDRMGLVAHYVIPIRQIPKTTSGKLRRVFLADQYKNGNYDGLLKIPGVTQESLLAERPAHGSPTSLSDSSGSDVHTADLPDRESPNPTALSDADGPDSGKISGDSVDKAKAGSKGFEAAGAAVPGSAGGAKGEASEMAASVSSFSLDRTTLRRSVETALCRILGRDSFPDDIPFSDAGLNSLKAVRFNEKLREMTGVNIPVSAAFDYPDLNSLLKYLQEITDTEKGEASASAKVRESYSPESSREPVAIVGLSLNLPGNIQTLEELRELFWEGRHSVSLYPENRPGVTVSELINRELTAGSYLDDVAGFDNTLFSVMPAEAAFLDPQQRLLLESVYHAFEDANISPNSVRGGQTGVFVGISSNDYKNLSPDNLDAAEPGPYSVTGSMTSAAAGRISYQFGLQGPSIAVDTACSSSLVALHQAIQSIRLGESDMAVVSGANLILDLRSTRGLHAMDALSKDGRCKSFDDSADGYGRSEGIITLVLKPLSKAVEEGHQIYGVLHGSAVNHDGRSNGLTAPNGPAQEAVIRRALSSAGITPDKVTVVETHGTGTRLGDPQEAEALSHLFSGSDRTEKVLLSAAKACLGHLESAAGLAGLLKALLIIRHRELPAHPLASGLNRLIPWEEMSVDLPVGTTPLDMKQSEITVGVSSFGLSGTNAHVILSGYDEAVGSIGPVQADSGTDIPLLSLGARSPEAMPELMRLWTKYLSEVDEEVALDALDTGLTGRHSAEYRYSVAARTVGEIRSRLASDSEAGHVAQRAPFYQYQAKTAFLFTGQGSQKSGLARSLYLENKTFRKYISLCDEILNRSLDGVSLESLICDDDERIHQTRYTQPALAAVEISLAWTLRDLGLSADCVTGHSLGEYVALCYAGVISLEDMLRLVAERGRLMSGISTGGSMAVIFEPRSRVEQFCVEAEVSVDIASDNGNGSVTVSGKTSEIDTLLASAADHGFRYKKLKVEQAFHSSLMDPVLEAFEKIAEKVPFEPAEIPVILNREGMVLEPGQSIDAAYLASHIRRCVDFGDGLATLAEMKPDLILEVGPSPALLPLAAAQTGCEHIYSLLRGGDDAHLEFTETVVNLYSLGLPLQVEKLKQGRYRKVSVPKYPFQHQPFWYPASALNSEVKAGVGNGYENRSAGTEVFNSTEHPASSPAQNGGSYEDKRSPEAVMPDQRQAPEVRLDDMVGLMAEVTGFSVAQLDTRTNLFELGLDSLVLLRVKAVIKERYGVDIAASRFFQEANTIEKLTAVVGKESSIEAANMPVNGKPEVQADGGGSSDSAASPAAGSQEPAGSASNAGAMIADRDYVAYKNLRDQKGPVPVPQEGLRKLIREYNAITGKSKAEVANYRRWLATSRNIAGFRPDRKEMVYQLHIDRAEGAYVFDIDGNKLLDITMGFGTALFGNKPDFIEKALQEEMTRGIGVGAMSYRTGRVARKFCEMTGHDRVVFFNTGSEAVMNALRLARTATGKSKVVQFSGAYHGNADTVLGVMSRKNGQPAAMPMSPGIPDSYMDELVVLPYGDPESLRHIESIAGELAAVIVEPVQSRRPGYQPGKFLKELRKLTAEREVVLIMDEMITGLRAGPRGAQGFFGVEGDLACYGKIIGGGLPVGLVAGKRAVMDAVDGGRWNYGDDSYPEAENTFSAGTFNHHPMVLATMEAVLDKIAADKNQIYPGLEEKTGRFADELNHFFKESGYPAEITRFGSLFRFNLSGAAELLYYKLVTKGVYIWEGRNCFLSTAHSDEDIRLLIDSVKAALEEMREDGFFPLPSANHAGDVSDKSVQRSGDRTVSEVFFDQNGGVAVVPLSNGTTKAGNQTGSVFPQHPIQQRIFSLSSLSGGNEAYQIGGAMGVRGPFDHEKFQEVCRELVQRHEAFRTVFSIEKGELLQRTIPYDTFDVAFHDVRGSHPLTEIEKLTNSVALNSDRPVTIKVLWIDADEYILLINAHHIAIDGISLNIFFEEFLTRYFGGELPAKAPAYRAFVEWQEKYKESDTARRDEVYWKLELENLPEPVVPAPDRDSSEFSFRGGRITRRMPVQPLKEIARRNGVSPFTLTLGTFALWLYRVTGRQDFVIGGVVSGRPAGFESTMGMFVNTIPYRFTIDGTLTGLEFIQQLGTRILSHLDKSFYPFERFVNSTEVERTAGTNPIFDTAFTYEKDTQRSVTAGDLVFENFDLPKSAAAFPFSLDLIETESELIIGFDYQESRYSKKRVEELSTDFTGFLNGAGELFQRPLSEIDRMDPDEIKDPANSETTDGTGKDDSFRNTGSQATTDSVRALLENAWEKVLKTDMFDGDTSFFRLGGDSIKAIQLVSLLTEEGYQAQIETIFQHPTINKLVSALEQTRQPAEGKSFEGTLPLLPVQEYLVDLDLENIHHWNQAVWLTLTEQVSKQPAPETLQSLLAFVCERHPMLRAVLQERELFIRPVDTPGDSLFLVETLQMENDEADPVPFAKQPLLDLQKRMNIHHGPAIGLLCIHQGNKSHLIWVIHHLLVDAVSWHILIDDLSAILASVKRGVSVKRQPVLSSAAGWVEKSLLFFNEVREDQYEYWREQLKADGEIIDGAGRRCRTDLLETEQIQLPEPLSAAINDISLTYGNRYTEAFFLAAVLKGITGTHTESVNVLLEGHGRRFRGEEVADAVGWFTSMYPLKIDLGEKRRHFVEQLMNLIATVPDNGLGFGYLRKTFSDSELDRLPDIRFNFLGTLPSDLNGITVGLVDNRWTIASDNLHDVSLDVNVAQVNGTWTITVDYHPEVWGRVVPAVNSMLQEMIGRFQQEKPGAELTAIEPGRFFEDSGIADESRRVQLVKQAGILPEEVQIGDAYPLTPLQQGLLYDVSLSTGVQTGLVQLALSFNGTLDESRLRNALLQVIKRHKPLHSIFNTTTTNPLQFIIQPDIDFRVCRWGKFDETEFEKRLRDLKKIDLLESFDLQATPPLRFTMVKGPTSKDILIMSVHHIIFDGWSNDLFLSEVTAIYNGSQTLLREPFDYARYVKQVLASDSDSNRNYWKEILAKVPQRDMLEWAYQNPAGQIDDDGVIRNNSTDALAQRLADRVRGEELTLNAALQGAWGATLSLLNGEEITVFGSVYSGRTGGDRKAEKGIGLFISTVPFVCRFDNNKPLTSWLKETMDSMISHQVHQFVSLAELGNKRDKGRLFDTLLVIENYPLDIESYKFEGRGKEQISIESYTFHSEESVPLTLSINFEPVFEIELQYDTSKITRRTAENISGTYLYVLEKLASGEFKTTGELRAAWKDHQVKERKKKNLKSISLLKKNR